MRRELKTLDQIIYLLYVGEKVSFEKIRLHRGGLYVSFNPTFVSIRA